MVKGDNCVSSFVYVDRDSMLKQSWHRKTPTITVSSENSFHRLTIRCILESGILQKWT